jgi:hypothetical protein
MLFFQVIVGYLLAGSLVGPGGLNFISEMVQVTESLAAYKLHFCPLFSYFSLNFLIKNNFFTVSFKQFFCYICPPKDWYGHLKEHILCTQGLKLGLPKAWSKLFLSLK